MQGRGNAGEQPRCPAMHSRGATLRHHTASSYTGSTEIPLFFKILPFGGGGILLHTRLLVLCLFRKPSILAVPATSHWQISASENKKSVGFSNQWDFQAGCRPALNPSGLFPNRWHCTEALPADAQHSELFIHLLTHAH